MRWQAMLHPRSFYSSGLYSNMSPADIAARHISPTNVRKPDGADMPVLHLGKVHILQRRLSPTTHSGSFPVRHYAPSSLKTILSAPLQRFIRFFLGLNPVLEYQSPNTLLRRKQLKRPLNADPVSLPADRKAVDSVSPMVANRATGRRKTECFHLFTSSSQNGDSHFASTAKQSFQHKQS